MDMGTDVEEKREASGRSSPTNGAGSRRQQFYAGHQGES